MVEQKSRIVDQGPSDILCAVQAFIGQLLASIITLFFVPTYLVAKNFSNPSACTNLFKIAFQLLGECVEETPSIAILELRMVGLFPLVENVHRVGLFASIYHDSFTAN